MSDVSQGRVPANDLTPTGNSHGSTPVNYAPIVERAPELVGDTIFEAHKKAAEQILQAMDALQQELNDCIQHGRATAQAIMDYGTAEAAATTKTLAMVRDMSRVWREQGKRLTDFASGART